MKKPIVKRPFRFSERELAIIANLDAMAPGAQREFGYAFRKEEEGTRLYDKLDKMLNWYHATNNQLTGGKMRVYGIGINRTSPAPGIVSIVAERIV